MLTFDAHLDLSLNGVEYGRDLRLSIEEIRSNESGMTDLGGRQRSTVCFPGDAEGRCRFMRSNTACWLYETCLTSGFT